METVFAPKTHRGRGARRLAADAPGPERPDVGAELVERTGERLDVAVGKVAGKVLLDPVPVAEAGLLHSRAPLVGEDDEDRAAVVLWADAADEPGLFHAIDDAREAALAVEDPLGELVHA